MSSFTYKDLHVEVIYNKKLRHSYIKVIKEFQVIIKTPVKSRSFLDELLASKYNWIKKQSEILKNRPRDQKINLEDEVLLFGEIYSIDHQEVSKLQKALNKIAPTEDDNNKILKAYDKFYKDKAKEYITQRVEYFSSLMQLRYSELKFRKMKSKWGSCSSAKIITFNTELIKLKKELIDYVVVHELSHLREMNHSKHFYKIIERYLPHYKELKKQMRHN
jgi:predicted metal-dependent hydrolase